MKISGNHLRETQALAVTGKIFDKTHKKFFVSGRARLLLVPTCSGWVVSASK